MVQAEVGKKVEGLDALVEGVFLKRTVDIEEVNLHLKRGIYGKKGTYHEGKYIGGELSSHNYQITINTSCIVHIPPTGGGGYVSILHEDAWKDRHVVLGDVRGELYVMELSGLNYNGDLKNFADEKLIIEMRRGVPDQSESNCLRLHSVTERVNVPKSTTPGKIGVSLNFEDHLESAFNNFIKISEI